MIVYALTDYKNHFGSKWKSNPYRSGYDKNIMKELFNKEGYEIKFISFHDINFTDSWKDRVVIYTSSEEYCLHYKSFIEDIILTLERLGAIILPKYDYLRANNNKVYMEILKQLKLNRVSKDSSSRYYGTLDELSIDLNCDKIKFPCVIKSASGAMSRGVHLAKNKKELVKYAKVLSSSSNYKINIKEQVRKLKYKGYLRESAYQNKFIIQKFIPNLKNDWKILIYYDHYYILNRGIKKNDFRASGSHFNYKAGSKSEFPLRLFEEVKKIYETLDIPNLSLDLAYNQEDWYIIEFQCLNFGTSTIEFSKDYYDSSNKKWLVKSGDNLQEYEYTYSIINYIKKKLL